MSDHLYTNSIIVYKYNKYSQINGSLFYAFEYLLAAVDKISEASGNISASDLPTLCIVGLPSSIKVSYSDNLNKLFAGKYPHPDNKKKIINALDNKINSILLTDSREYNRLIKIKEDYKKYLKIIKYAISRIKFPTDIEFRKLLIQDNNNIIFASTNSILNYIDTFQHLKNTQVKLIQNRNLRRSKDLRKKLIPLDNLEYLYELPQQKPEHNKNCKEYAPKICFKYYLNKEILDLFPKTYDIIVNHIKQDPNCKPQFFCHLKNHFFLNTTRIVYTRNLTRWEENVRIIPEAKFYKIKLRIIEENQPIRFDDKDSLIMDTPETIDSSVTRYNNKWEDYNLEQDDYLINFILKEEVDVK